MTIAGKNDVLLDVRNLEITVDARQGPVRVVRDVSLHVKRGETLAIVGESGSGKSITMLGVAGLLPSGARITGGTSSFEGRDLMGMSPRELRSVRGRSFGFVFQDPMTALNPVMRIGDQISESMVYNLRLSDRQARHRSVELLEHVGVFAPERCALSYPYQLSGGMRQRALIAIAISCNPSILIADEPTTALDVTVQAQVVDLLKRLCRERDMAMIWISHDLTLAAGLADRVSVLYSGRIIESGLVDDVFANPRHPYTQGLLSSVPKLEGPRMSRLYSLPGTPPDSGTVKAGCSFAPRCPLHKSICLEHLPLLEFTEPVISHGCACHFAERSEESKVPC